MVPLSRNRSGGLHAVGNDQGGEAPAPQHMDRADAPLSVQCLSMDTVEKMRTIHNDGFGGKVCCLCCPVADTGGRIKRFYTKHPERLPMCGVALGQDGTPLGYVQLAIYPMNDKDGLHNTSPGETYIEQISVAAAARGQGVGKLLLQWAEARARERSSTTLTLAVLNGNPARRLYERFGLQVVSTDPCDEFFTGLVVCCVVGRQACLIRTAARST